MYTPRRKAHINPGSIEARGIESFVKSLKRVLLENQRHARGPIGELDLESSPLTRKSRRRGLAKARAQSQGPEPGPEEISPLAISARPEDKYLEEPLWRQREPDAEWTQRGQRLTSRFSSAGCRAD
ncbi:hypothetical protein KM043_001199 [Ampulex compressa]|nr:hypothetical protein KM043_001199 [Ampulex compressa]